MIWQVTLKLSDMDYRGLMVGDWLLDKEEGLPRRVTQVTSDVLGGCAPGVILENGMDYQECEPIPLTAEILEANGFELCSNGWIVWTSTNDKEVAWLYNSLSIITCTTESIYLETCCYVHELQHALRLCGLNELADNFKV